MSTGQPDRPAAAMSPPGGGSVAFGDLTARARIREAAIQHFAEEGYERTTIRVIAQTAGVSPGLLRHHFGSKEELRRACDEYVAGMLRQVNAQVLADPGQATAARRDAKRYHRYIVRALADGSGEAGPIFDEMVTQTEQWLARADAARPDPPAVDLRIRAVLVTAMAAGIPLLHDHVSRALGADIFEPEGDRLLTLGLLDIYSHTLINGETASAAEAGLDLPDQPAGGENNLSHPHRPPGRPVIFRCRAPRRACAGVGDQRLGGGQFQLEIVAKEFRQPPSDLLGFGLRSGEPEQMAYRQYRSRR
jgi:AcrR family transcriptional regulator